MAEITLQGGVSIDVATKDDLLGWHRKLIEKITPPHARYYRVYASIQTSSGFTGSGPIAMAFEPPRPPAGRIWALQWVATWVGTSPAGAAVGNLNASVMIGRSPVGAGQTTIAGSVTVNDSDVVIPGQSVPSSISVPDKTICTARDQAYILLAGSGLAASTQYNASCGLLDMPETAEAVLW